MTQRHMVPVATALDSTNSISCFRKTCCWMAQGCHTLILSLHNQACELNSTFMFIMPFLHLMAYIRFKRYFYVSFIR